MFLMILMHTKVNEFILSQINKLNLRRFLIKAETCIEDRIMNIDKIVFRFAGSVILISLILSQLHSVHWLWLTGFVGLNMLQASFTGFCPLARILKKIGVTPGPAF